MEEGGKVIKKKKLRGLIHPVIPVLKETRSIVAKYNYFFKRAVKEFGEGMVWVDIFEDLVEAGDGPGGLSLRSG